MSSPVQAIQNLPEIERYPDGTMKEDSRCATAIMGMPPSDLADKLGLYENEYQAWKANPNEDTWMPVRIILKNVAVPVRILRGALADAALAYAKLCNDQKAQVQNADSAAQFQGLLGDHRSLRVFLYANFPEDLDKADALNTPLLTVAMDIMLRAKAVRS